MEQEGFASDPAKEQDAGDHTILPYDSYTFNGPILDLYFQEFPPKLAILTNTTASQSL